MKTSESIELLALALANAQGEFASPVFDSVNPAFKSKYASLASMLEAVRPSLNKHKIALVQNVIESDNAIGVSTLLLHNSGQYMESEPFWVRFGGGNNPAHVVGSAHTYARRYSLQGFLGIVGEPDDDGNAVESTKAEAAALELLLMSAKKGMSHLDSAFKSIPPNQKARLWELHSSTLKQVAANADKVSA